MAVPTRGFRTPPEVTGYFDGKTDRPGFSWLDVWAKEHAHAFTVAKAVDAELLGAFRRTISSAIAGSRSFETWRDEVQGELQRLGWWGPRRVGDPAGTDPDALVDFSSRRRLETIFHSNMRAARAAGQWERIQRTKRGLPYLLYVRTAASDPRKEHLGWVGTILPVDDAFWATHFPPNGWGCKCSVRQITRREREQLLDSESTEGGIVYQETPPDDGPPQRFRNRRTGEVTEIPAGIDPGWHTNPGLSRSKTLIDNLAGKLDEAAKQGVGGTADATRILQELWQDPFLELAPKLPDQTWLPAGVSPALQETLGAKSPIVAIPTNVIRERMERHGMAMADFAKLPAIVGEAAILPDVAKRPEPNARTIFARDGKTWWRAIVVMARSGLMRVRSIHQRDAQRVADQILDAGLGAADLVAAGFTNAEISALIVSWERRRGGREKPPRP